MNSVFKKFRQSDTSNDKNLTASAKAVVMMGLFTFIFLGTEYLFVNMVSRAVSENTAVAAQNYVLGVSVLGFLIYPLFRRAANKKFRTVLSIVGTAAAVAGIFGLCFTPFFGTVLSLGLAVFLLLGIFGSAVFYKSICLIESNKHIARLVGFSYMLGVLLQFANNNLIRAEKAEAAVLSVFLSALTAMLINAEKAAVPPAFSANNGQKNPQNISKKSVAVGLWLTLLVVLMTCVFSTLDNAVTVYHASGTQNIGQWPRILLAASGLCAGFVFDIKNRKFMSIIMYCVMILSTICIAVLQFAVPFLVALVIFYASAGFFAVFFTTAFMEIARYTKLPDLWSGLGRAVNNLTAVCITGISLKLLSADNHSAIIIAVPILFVAVSIAALLYSVRRNSFFDEIETADNQVLDEHEKLSKLSEKYSLTPRESEVFELLVNTEDNIQTIADNLYISRRTLERYISAIYEKTGVKSRVGLAQIYNK